MEFLLLAVLGLATFGAKEMLSGEEEEKGQDSNNAKSNTKNGAKDKSKNGKDSEDSETPKKTAKQELIEAIARYEAENREGEISKLLYEITEK